jgi:hypothetical protein
MNMEKSDIRILEDYCRSEFLLSSEYSKKKSVHQGSWCRYKRFEILGTSKLKVLYEYGYGQISHSGEYLIHLGEDYRDKKIADILSKM